MNPIVEKTVFLSYRRQDLPLALLVFKELTHQGFDVFLDIDGLGSGDFERVILKNIVERAHFVVLLTLTALDRCEDPTDLFRREIEAAIDARRNVIALLDQKFDYGLPNVKERLVGKIGLLARYNGLKIPLEYHEAALKRLCEKYLNVALHDVVHPALPGTTTTAPPSGKATPHTRGRPPVESHQKVGILLIAHTPLASALGLVAQHVYPESESDLAVLDVSPDSGPDEIIVKAREMVERFGARELLVLTDVFGATPCNVAQLLLNAPSVAVVTGVNVPMLWRVLAYLSEPLEQLVDRAVAGGTQGAMKLWPRKSHGA